MLGSATGQTQVRVSVPFRGFRGLQEPATRWMLLRGIAFQSPSGVLGVCRVITLIEQGVALDEFQSPSGVLGVCRLPQWKWCDKLRIRFQSPSGVLGVCRAWAWAGSTACVSVPFRGFRGLQDRRGSSRIGLNATVVSVPFRGFRGLQARLGGHHADPKLERFSPLPGF